MGGKSNFSQPCSFCWEIRIFKIFQFLLLPFHFFYKNLIHYHFLSLISLFLIPSWNRYPYSLAFLPLLSYSLPFFCHSSLKNPSQFDFHFFPFPTLILLQKEQARSMENRSGKWNFNIHCTFYINVLPQRPLTCTSTNTTTSNFKIFHPHYQRQHLVNLSHINPTLMSCLSWNMFTTLLGSEQPTTSKQQKSILRQKNTQCLLASIFPTTHYSCPV